MELFIQTAFETSEINEEKLCIRGHLTSFSMSIYFPIKTSYKKRQKCTSDIIQSLLALDRNKSVVVIPYVRTNNEPSDNIPG